MLSAALIVLLAVSTTSVQFFRSSELNNNDYNTRTIYNEYGKNRGSILVSNNGQAVQVAYSEPSGDNFKYQRVYPDSDFAPVTGFFSIANRADRGIEAAQNSALNGDIDELSLTNFMDTITSKEKRGADVLLTLNYNLQKLATKLLNESGFKGAVVAVEPATGKILAMASNPSVDYNAFAIHDTEIASKAYTDAANNADSPMLSRATDAIYPPGSTFKVITSAAAIETGQYQSDSVIEAPVNYRLPGTLTDLPNYAGGNCRATGGFETMTRALEQSCNTAFAKLGVDLGLPKMLTAAENFGFNGSFTLAEGVAGDKPFGSEVSVFPAKMSDDRLAMGSIGQGDVAVTPLQDCLISAVIANKGRLMSPYLVDALQTIDGGVLKNNEPAQKAQVISEETASQIAQMMYSDVVNGIVSAAAVKGVKVAGKTGTAENDPSKPAHAWFTGFAPLDNPSIALCVFLENGGIGIDSAKMASQIFSAYINGGAL